MGTKLVEDQAVAFGHTRALHSEICRWAVAPDGLNDAGATYCHVQPDVATNTIAARTSRRALVDGGWPASGRAPIANSRTRCVGADPVRADRSARNRWERAFCVRTIERLGVRRSAAGAGGGRQRGRHALLASLERDPGVVAITKFGLSRMP